jgi:7-keto-8-aminopelargonate synthetase-like enzyme
LSANNYLGLANDPRIVGAAIEATQKWGAGRFDAMRSGMSGKVLLSW